MFHKKPNKETNRGFLRENTQSDVKGNNNQDDFFENNSSNSQAKNKFNFKTVLIIVLAVLIIGGGYLFYYEKGQAMFLSWKMKWGLISKTDNYYTKANLNIDLDNIALKKGDIKTPFMPDTDKIKKASFGIQGENTVIGNDLESLIHLDLDIGKELNIDSRIKKIGEKFYLRPEIYGLNDFIPFIPISDSDIGEDWILLNSKDKDKDISNIAPLPFLNLGQSQVSILNVDLQNKFSKFFKGIKKDKIFSIHDPHKTKTIQGEKLKEIKYTIKENKINDLILLAINTFSKNEKTIKQNEKEFTKYYNNNPKQWDNLEKLIKSLDLSVWVNLKTKLIKGIEVDLKDFSLNIADFSSDIEVSFSVLTKDIKEKEILPPKEYISLKEFVKKFQKQAAPVQKENDNVKQNKKPDWSVDFHQYEHNGTILAGVFKNGKQIGSETDIIAAFLNDDCIGIQQGMRFPMQDEIIFYLMVYGNKESSDEINFKYWDADEDKIYNLDNKKITFYPDMEKGSLDPYNPLVLNIESNNKDNDKKQNNKKSQLKGTSLLLDNIQVSSGESFSVPIKVNNMVDMQGLNITVKFDPNVIQSNGATLKEGTMLESRGSTGKAEVSKRSGEIILGYATAYSVTGSGKIAYLEFKAIGKSGDKSDLKFSQAILNETSYLDKAIHGSIEIK